MFTPRFDSIASSTVAQSSVRSPHDISVAEAPICVMPADEWRAR